MVKRRVERLTSSFASCDGLEECCSGECELSGL